jgi:glycosyltransferase involved in cell wall biosynthesis
MTRRRVLVVAPQPFYEERGTPIAVRHLLTALSELDFEVDVLTYPVGASPAIPNVHYVRIANPLRIRKIPIGFSLRKLWLDALLLFALRRQLRKQRYEYVHALEEAAYLAVLAARRRGVPIVYDMHSSIPEQLAEHAVLGKLPVRTLFRSIERRVTRSADRIVCSTGLAHHVRDLAPEADVREWRFPRRVQAAADDPLGLRESLDIADGRKVILYAGNTEDYQGLSALVAAIPLVLVREPNAVFVIVGAEGASAQRVEQSLASAVPADAYRLLGRLPRDRALQYLRIADIAVSPRIRGDNIPLKIFDYLCAGRAIVATSIPAHHAILDSETAKLVEPTSQALGQALADLLENPAETERLKRAALTYAEKYLTWNSFLQSVKDLYTDPPPR